MGHKSRKNALFIFSIGFYLTFMVAQEANAGFQCSLPGSVDEIPQGRFESIDGISAWSSSNSLQKLSRKPNSASVDAMILSWYNKDPNLGKYTMHTYALSGQKRTYNYGRIPLNTGVLERSGIVTIRRDRPGSKDDLLPFEFIRNTGGGIWYWVYNNAGQITGSRSYGNFPGKAIAVVSSGDYVLNYIVFVSSFNKKGEVDEITVCDTPRLRTDDSLYCMRQLSSNEPLVADKSIGQPTSDNLFAYSDPTTTDLHVVGVTKTGTQVWKLNTRAFPGQKMSALRTESLTTSNLYQSKTMNESGWLISNGGRSANAYNFKMSNPKNTRIDYSFNTWLTQTIPQAISGTAINSFSNFKNNRFNVGLEGMFALNFETILNSGPYGGPAIVGSAGIANLSKDYGISVLPSSWVPQFVGIQTEKAIRNVSVLKYGASSAILVLEIGDQVKSQAHLAYCTHQ